MRSWKTDHTYRYTGLKYTDGIHLNLVIYIDFGVCMYISGGAF